MRVTVGRDQVHWGDDALDLELHVDDGATIFDVLFAMHDAQYLPRIGGGQATWVVEGAKPVAVIAQQWMIPRWLVAPDLPLAEARDPSGQYDLWVHYRADTDPEKLYEVYRDNGSSDSAP